MRGLFPSVIAVLLVPIIFAPLSLLLDYSFGNPDEELLSPAGLLAVYWSELTAVAPVAIAVAAVTAFILSKQGQPEEQEADDPAPALRRLLQAVPASLGDDIIRLHAQDHYVEVVTVKGRALLTEQFGECLEKLSPLPGIQCHRSHWVALPHVKGVSRSGSAIRAPRAMATGCPSATGAMRSSKGSSIPSHSASAACFHCSAARRAAI